MKKIYTVLQKVSIANFLLILVEYSLKSLFSWNMFNEKAMRK